jgi:feruloyl esterase
MGRFERSVGRFHACRCHRPDPFTKRGGKIIIFHGVSDPVFSINDTLRWLAQVDAREGPVGAFRPILAVPGMNHGRGGPATDHFDIFSQLVAWRKG